MKTIRISDEVHQELTRVIGQLTMRNSEIKTYNDAIQELLTFWKKKKNAPHV